MSDKTVFCPFPLPGGGGSVLKKRAAAWFTMRSWGPEAPGQPALGPVVSGGRAGRPRDWGLPQQAVDF